MAKELAKLKQVPPAVKRTRQHSHKDLEKETGQNGGDLAQAVVETVREPLLVLSGELRIKLANRSFYQTFQVSPEEAENRLLYELGNHQWDIPKLRELLEDILPKDGQFHGFEVDHEFPTVGRRIMLIDARRLRRRKPATELILLAIEDITERRRAEDQLTRQREHLEELVDERAKELKVANAQLVEEVAEHKRAEEERERQNRELDAFTYSVSHDLKEPLRAIEAFSQFVLEDCADRLDEQGREYLLKLASAAVRMKKLIEDLLTLSRASRESRRRTQVDVGRLVRDVVERMSSTVEGRGATVEVEDGLPDVLADPPRVEEVFANLLGNALKFNESKRPSVKIGVRAIEGGMATFYVQDNGIGIDPRYHERIFGIFQRLHRREEYEGTGAGLAIVKRLVEIFGGRTWVESERGAGATFLFTLPLWTEATASTERKVA
jgi:two-component system CheB/CheR fusion protein